MFMFLLDHSTSDGTGAFSQAIEVAIFDYQRVFGVEPKLIVIPYFRMDEMDALLLMACGDQQPKVRGIPFRLSIISDVIELYGRPE